MYLILEQIRQLLQDRASCFVEESKEYKTLQTNIGHILELEILSIRGDERMVGEYIKNMKMDDVILGTHLTYDEKKRMKQYWDKINVKKTCIIL